MPGAGNVIAKLKPRHTEPDRNRLSGKSSHTKPTRRYAFGSAYYDVLGMQVQTITEALYGATGVQSRQRISRGRDHDAAEL